MASVIIQLRDFEVIGRYARFVADAGALRSLENESDSIQQLFT